MNVKLTLSFDGSNYHGWQIQQNAVGVQEIVQKAIYKITGEHSTVVGCSRTDAGVHALVYVCNFFTNTNIPPDKLPLALNTKLPHDIKALQAKYVSDDFNARFCAKNKTYIYKIHTATIADPFMRNYAFHYPPDLDVSQMQSSAAHFLGRHDFAGFVAAGGSHKTTLREIYELSVAGDNPHITIKITANAFLYNMVRIIAGTLCYVGRGKIRSDDITSIIAAGNRRLAGITAPPQGLYLANVQY